jgi:hypothetical protein
MNARFRDLQMKADAAAFDFYLKRGPVDLHDAPDALFQLDPQDRRSGGISLANAVAADAPGDFFEHRFEPASAPICGYRHQAKGDVS